MKTYWEVMALVRPFFLSRWGDVISKPDIIFDFINCSIQDIYNDDDATFTYIHEVVPRTIQWDKSIYKTSFPIRKLNVAKDSQYSTEYTPTLEEDCECDCSIRVGDEFLYLDGTTQTPNSLVIDYIRDYKWAIYDKDMTTPVPLPNRYIPALIKFIYDWASPINLMVSEAAATDFYAHAATRLDKLKANDGVTNRFKY
jgi:hypothetical protein